MKSTRQEVMKHPAGMMKNSKKLIFVWIRSNRLTTYSGLSAKIKHYWLLVYCFVYQRSSSKGIWRGKSGFLSLVRGFCRTHHTRTGGCWRTPGCWCRASSCIRSWVFWILQIVSAKKQKFSYLLYILISVSKGICVPRGKPEDLSGMSSLCFQPSV